MDSFNSAFIWLPEEDPANIIEILSDSDTDRGADEGVRTNQPTAIPEDLQGNQPPAESEAASAFRATIGRSVPLHFIEGSLRRRIQHAANEILDLASALDISLRAISIDANCLPTWPARAWDPARESLHDVLQCGMMAYQAAEEIGPTMRSLIITLGNERIEDALLLGLELRQMVIGEDLLPTWPDRDRAFETEDADGTDNDDYTVMDVNGSVHSEDLPLLDASLPMMHAAVQQPIQTSRPEDEPQSASSSDAESESCASEPQSDYDDEISLFNFVSQLPVVVDADGFVEEDAPLRNIVHNVDVFGASFNGRPVDFEVYLAENDPDVVDLPELEIAIDEEPFVFHHHDHYVADAVDLELAGQDIYFVTPRREADDAVEDLDAVPDCTMESTDREGSSVEPVTPDDGPSDVEAAEAATDWIMV